MGFTVCYRSTRVVTPKEAADIERTVNELSRGRTWLSCEPVHFYRDREDGRLLGGSKPNFEPDPGDAAAAAASGLPDGTTRDLLDILCELSRKHGVDWEISHDHSGGPVGCIRDGVCDDEVVNQLETFADVGDMLRNLEDGFEMPVDGPEWNSENKSRDPDDDDGPRILKFRPKH